MEEKEEVTIEYSLDSLVKGAGTGWYVHRRSDMDGWCGKYGPDDSTTNIPVTEDEIEKNIVIARREARNSVARLQNLEKLSFELCKTRNKHV
jgi:hypothetical protein